GWLLQANLDLAGLIAEAVGAGWVTDLDRLRQLRPLAEDAAFRGKFRAAQRKCKERFARWLQESTGVVIDPTSLLDCQVKRIHEYKRQLLNVLHVAVLFNRVRAGHDIGPPRTFVFAGKAAPAYHPAKMVIRLINTLAAAVDAEPAAHGRLRVVFVPDYRVTVAERIIPAADISEQISTAGYEASGTSNMKFMLNGALTVGT